MKKKKQIRRRGRRNTRKWFEEEKKNQVKKQRSKPTWEDSFYVPSEDKVDDGVKKHHRYTSLQTKSIVGDGTCSNVAPLCPNSLLLILSKVTEAITHGNVGGQALHSNERKT